MKLFVGLGNPGGKYAGNRHNVGFMAVDEIARAHGFSAWRKRFSGLTADGNIDGEKVLLLKPATYMNESGRSVGEAVRYLKLDLADVTVFFDEIDLAPGKLKVKTGGGNAGHNGLRSITHLVGNEYVRVRIGVGHPGVKELVAGYVLHDFAKADREWLEPLLGAIADAVPHLVADDQPRFLTDVAAKINPQPAKAEKKAPKAGKKPRAEGKPKQQQSEKPDSPANAAGDGSSPAKQADDAKAAKPQSLKPKANHPTGERNAKRQGALAEQLKKFLGRRS